VIAATFLALYVVPSIYTYFDDILPLSRRLLGKLQGFAGRFTGRPPKTEEPIRIGGVKDDGDGLL
jgi:hypothetical protein